MSDEDYGRSGQLPAPREIAALVVAAGFVALLFWLGLVMKAIEGAIVAVLAAVVLALFGGLVVMFLSRPLARIAPPTYRVAYQASACAIAVYIWTVWMSMLIVEHLGWGGPILQLAAWAHSTLNLTEGRMGVWYTYFALAQLPGLLACAGVLSGTLEGWRGLAGYGKACLLSIPLITVSLAVAAGWGPIIRQVISGQG